VENLIIAVLSRKRPHAAVGYAVTLLLVIAVLLAELHSPPPSHPYLPFVLVILLAALAFGRGAGLFATLLSAVVADWCFIGASGGFSTNWPKFGLLLLFIAIGIGISILVDELCHAVRKLHLAEAEKSLLLDELSHRTRNDMMLIASVLALQAMRETEPHTRSALDSAVARVRVVAAAQERLSSSGQQGQVEVSSYLKALGDGLGDLLRDVRPITVHVHASPMAVAAPIAVSIGLMMNELVTNAFKYAFPDGQDGTVQVSLERADNGIALSVQDDGVGCPAESIGGLGTRLVQKLAAQLGGKLERQSSPRGHHVRITLPINPAAPSSGPDVP
jgi:two-component sensor histidine kinase